MSSGRVRRMSASLVRTSFGLGIFGTSNEETQQKMIRIREQVKTHIENLHTTEAKIRLFLESPYSSPSAYTYASFMTLVVMSSVVISFMQTIDEYVFMRGPFFDIVQVTFECIFAMELLMRLYVCDDRLYFIFGMYNFIDAISVLPLFFRSYIAINDGLQVDASGEKTLLAIVPVIHISKLLRRFEKLQLLVSAFEVALEALPVLLYTFALIAIFFSEVLYLLEPRDNFEDLPTALWFTVVTMTTVGYGDKTPANAGGHVVATVLIIISALYMAIPIGIVGHAFSQVWSDRDRLLVMQRFRTAFLGGGFTVRSVQTIFNMFDEDGNGELDVDEFKLMLQTMNLNMEDERISLLYQNLDTEGKGYISVDALIDGLVPKAFTHKFFSSRDPSQKYSMRPTTDPNAAASTSASLNKEKGEHQVTAVLDRQPSNMSITTISSSNDDRSTSERNAPNTIRNEVRPSNLKAGDVDCAADQA
jgi:hypothetical protein